MQLTPVKSSNIKAIGFKEETCLTLNSKPITALVIQFTHGDIYNYYGVTKEMYKEFLEAESIGKYFHSKINNKFDFEKVKIEE